MQRHADGLVERLATAGHRFGYETLARRANADHCGPVLLASVVVARQNPGVDRHKRSSIDAHANVRGYSTSLERGPYSISQGSFSATSLERALMRMMHKPPRLHRRQTRSRLLSAPRPNDDFSSRLIPVCTENLKSDHSGDEVRPGWRMN